MLVEYVKDNYNARFRDTRYHRYIERHFSILLDAIVDEQTNGRKVELLYRTLL